MAWNITEATYVRKSIQVNGYPEDLCFSSDGFHLYIADGSGDNIIHYTLSKAWDVSTISYSELLSLASPNGQPLSVWFRSDGLSLYYTARDSYRFVNYKLTTAWDLSTASFVGVSDNIFSSINESYPNGMSMKPDGSRIYVCGYGTDKVWDIPLDTAWDITTVDFTRAVGYSSGASYIYGMYMSPDGNTLWTVDNTGDWIRQYNLSTAWDIGSKSYIGAIDTGAGTPLSENTPRGVFCKDDGQGIFMVGTSEKKVYQWNMPAPYVPPNFIPLTSIL